MRHKIYGFVKSYFLPLFFIALVLSTSSKYWSPIVESFNPITTPHQSWTELHHLVALLIGMVVFIGISTFFFSVFKILKKIDKNLAEQEKYSGQNLSKRRNLINISAVICALITGVIGLAGIGIFGYQILNHSTFGTVIQVSIVIILGLIASAFVIFVISFWLPNKIYSLIHGSLSNLSYKLLDCLVLDLKEDLQNLTSEIKSLADNEQSIRRQYITLKHQVDRLQHQFESESDEDVRDKIAYDKQVSLDRADDYKNKISELLDVQFDKQDEVNQIKSKIALAKMQREVIDEQENIEQVINYLESKNDHNGVSPMESVYRMNLETFDRIKAQIEQSLTKAEVAIKDDKESGSPEQKLNNIQDALAKLQKANVVGLAFKGFIQDEKQKTKSCAKELLEYIGNLPAEEEDKTKDKVQGKYRFYLNMASQYQEVLEELNGILPTVKDKKATLQHKLNLASADKNIQKSKKLSSKVSR